MVSQGHWQRLLPGTYLTHSGPVEWINRAWAGILRGGTGAMLAAESAGHLQGYVTHEPRDVTIYVPHSRSITSRDGWVFSRQRQLPKSVGTPPCTPPEQTLLELAILDPLNALTLFARATNNRAVTATALREALTSRSRIPHRAALTRALDCVDVGIHSELERVFDSDVVTAHGLPKPRRQRKHGAYRVDAEYDGVVVELDGRRYHEGEQRFRDMERDNYHMLRGIITLRFGWQQCTQDPCGVAAQVTMALQSTGLEVKAKPCRRCRSSK